MVQTIEINAPTYSFTVKSYHRLIEAGVLTEDDKVELIEGKIITMSPINSPHAACVDLLGDILNRKLGIKFIIRRQNPIILGTHSEPEPDLAVVDYREDYYTDEHPKVEQIHLAIEVAHSSENYDRTVKIPLYGKYGVPEAWLVNLNKKTVEVYQNPSQDGGYSKKEVFKIGDFIESQMVSGISIIRVFGKK